ncbi:MAG: EF-P 5-aminopentanol modification-associated protein YfmH, partial [Sulfobacillus sp.]
KEMGEMIGLFQSPEDLAYAFNSMYFRDIDLLSYIEVLNTITIQEIRRVRDEHLQEMSRAVSLILPASGGQT